MSLSFRIVALLLHAATIPVASCFSPRSRLNTSCVHGNNKCCWWVVGPKARSFQVIKSMATETKRLATTKSGINAARGDGTTALHDVCAKKSESAVRMLLESGADPTIQDKFGRTPLLVACDLIPPEESIIKVLLDYGANPAIADEDGNTPLHRACFFGTDIVEMLLKHGADPRAANRYGTTPFHNAAKHGTEPTMKLLLDHMDKNLL